MVIKPFSPLRSRGTYAAYRNPAAYRRESRGLARLVGILAVVGGAIALLVVVVLLRR